MTNQPENGASKKKPLKMMLKLLVSPRDGWRDIKHAGLPIQRIASELYYPILAVMAACAPFRMIYEAEVSLQSVIIDAVVSFVTFFAGFFAVIALSRWIFKGDVKEKFNSVFGHTVIMYSMSTLAMAYILNELLPSLEPLLVFFPLYTIYMLTVAVKQLRIDENSKVRVTVIISALLLGVPIVINRFLSEILPSL
jgi:hypothetical protein